MILRSPSVFNAARVDRGARANILNPSISSGKSPLLTNILPMKLTPLSNRVLIALTVEEAKATKSGIVLPETAEKKKQSRGAVVAVGPGRLTEKGERQPVAVKIGDTVLFKEPWSDDSKFEDAGKKFVLVEEDDILAIITE